MKQDLMKMALAVLTVLTTLIVVCGLAMADNSVTALYTNSSECYHNECGMEYVRANFDTTDTDLTINTSPDSTMTCMVGLAFSDSTPANLTIKSGTDTLTTLELGANQGVFSGNVGPFCTEEGEDLIMQVSALIGQIGIKFIESTKLRIK